MNKISVAVVCGAKCLIQTCLRQVFHTLKFVGSHTKILWRKQFFLVPHYIRWRTNRLGTLDNSTTRWNWPLHILLCRDKAASKMPKTAWNYVCASPHKWIFVRIPLPMPYQWIREEWIRVFVCIIWIMWKTVYPKVLNIQIYGGIVVVFAQADIRVEIVEI